MAGSTPRNRPILVAAVCLQLTLLGSIGLEVAGLGVYFLREFVGVVYLTLLPGFLLVRVIRLNCRSRLDEFLYAIGLSLTLSMFSGFALNGSFLVLGIGRPISAVPLLSMLSGIVIALTAVLFLRGVEGTTRTNYVGQFGFARLFSPTILFFALLPLLSAGGTLLVNEGGSGILLIALFVLVVAVPVLVVLDRGIKPALFPLAIFSIALSLAWQESLVSWFLAGWDIHIEYYYESLVLSHGFWDAQLPGTVNAMLSVSILVPEYSIIANVSPIWVAKAVYPALFSLVPVALYEAFRLQTTPKLAFLATFFFMCTNIFSDIVLLPRQEIAELFIALCILLLVTKAVSTQQRRLLFLIFALSVVVSHYGVSYLFAAYLAAAMLFSIYAKHRTYTSRLPSSITDSKNDLTIKRVPLSSGVLALFVVFALAWYIYSAGATPFKALVGVGNHIYGSFSELLDPNTRDPNVLLALGISSTVVNSFQRQVYVQLVRATQLLIVIGLTTWLLKRNELRFEPAIAGMNVTSTGLIAAGVALPYFASSLNMSRIYHIALFFLAPFFILGVKALTGAVRKGSHARSENPSRPSKLCGLASIAILVPYFLFGSGLVFQLTGDAPTSISLSPTLDYPRFNQQEVTAAMWLASRTNQQQHALADDYGRLLLYEFMYGSVDIVWGSTIRTLPGSPIFLRCANIQNQQIFASPTSRGYVALTSSALYADVLSMRGEVYDNGCAQVYM